MKMERDDFNNIFFTNNNLMPLPPSDFNPVCHNQLLLNSDPELASFSFPLNHQDSTHFFDFLSTSKPSYSQTFQPSFHQSHHQLTDPESSSSTRKRLRLDSSLQPPTHHMLPSPPVRSRRQKMSDKTLCLQKLMPFDKKMDIPTMLEEAHKYIRFLQAQIRALSSMPLHSSFIVQNDFDVDRFGRLGLLNRQQLLQVLLNSPVAQIMLYSQGFCVYSLEQLLLMKDKEGAKHFPQ